MSDASASVERQAASSARRKAATIVPLVLFFALGALINTDPLVDGQTVHPAAYFALVAARGAAMSVALIWFSNAIREQFPLQADRWGVVVGVVGAAVWIGVCALGIERFVLEMAGLAESWLPERESVDPFATYAAGLERSVFLLLRFTLLVACVPIAEELFLRGFLMRSVEAEQWDRISLSEIGFRGLALGTLYGVLTHPGEAVAAALWFSMVTLLMVKTGRFWNCVVAHAVTNLILGLYVCLTGNWHLW